MTIKKDWIFRRYALANNTFNQETVEKSLDEIKLSSLQYLYQLQNDMIRYTRYDFSMSDLQRSELINHTLSLLPRRWVLYVPCDFLDDNDRLRYKNSKFYDKELSCDDILNNKDIFTYSFLMFIDGNLCMSGINIYCKEDKTYCVFNIKEKPTDKGIEKEQLKYLMDINARITFIKLPNYDTMLLSSNANTIDHFNTANGGMSLKGFDLNNNTLCYCKLNDIYYGEEMTLTPNGDKYLIDKNYMEYVKKNYKDTSLQLRFINLPHYHTKVEVLKGLTDVWLQLDLEEYPISSDSCLIFDQNGVFMHDLRVEFYYPNIYKVKGEVPNDKTIKIYFFYCKNSKLLKHENRLKIYYKYTKDILDKYKKGNIPNMVKYYRPEDINYSIKNYQDSEYYEDHFQYKVEKMRELTKLDGEWFRVYLKNLSIQNKYYYIDISEINLFNRIRFSTNDCAIDEHEEFDSPMYKFTFANRFENRFKDLIVHADGTKIDHKCKIYGNKDYVYLFIPTNLIDNNTIIEIEKLPEYVKTYDFKGESPDRRTSINLKYPNNRLSKPLLNDIYLIDKDTNKFVDIEDYEIYDRISKDIIDSVHHDSFLECSGHFEIRAKKQSMLGTNYQMRISKCHQIYIRKIETTDDIMETIKWDIDCKKDSRYFRVYKNGRLLPRHIPIIRFQPDLDTGYVVIIPNCNLQRGDELLIEYMPYKMNQIYYTKSIEQFKMVNLEGFIDKPFDLRWHEVYINGRKLNKNNIDIISSNRIIIKNVRSTKNFEIVENNRDKEYFGYMPIKDIIDDLIDSNDEFKKSIEDTIKEIIDDEDDILDGNTSIYDYILYMFYHDYMVPEYGLINPDINQIDVETQERYSEIMDGTPFITNPDYGGLNATMLPVNPDDDSLG